MYKTYLKLALRYRAFWVLSACFALLMLLPFGMGTPTGSYNYSKQRLIDESALLDQQLSDGTYATAPDNLLACLSREQSLYREAKSEEEGSTEYFDCLLKLAELREEERASGFLSTDARLIAFDLTMLRSLAALDDPGLYSNASDLPALYYLSFLLRLLPSVFFFLPAFVASLFAVRLTSVGSLHSRTPMTPLQRYIIPCVLAASLVLVVYAFAGGFVFVMTLLSNGLGDPAYPVVVCVGGEIVRHTVLSSVATSLVAIFLVSLFVSAVGAFCTGSDRLRMLALGIAALVCVLPTTNFFHQMGEGLRNGFYSSPLALADYPSFSGSFGYAIVAEASSTVVREGVAFAGALVALLFVMGLAILFSFFTAGVRHRA